MLQIYNSLTREKRPFEPIIPGKVGIYVCGMTVYDYNHLGHARSLVCFDIIVRYLKASNYEVTYIRNITDIDDKIIKRAQENNESIDVLTQRVIEYNQKEEKALNLLAPDLEPRATAHIPEIINMIENLIKKEYAYVAHNGDVYYAVEKFNDYGKLSHKDLTGQQAGARIDVVEDKQGAADFVLWKQAKAGEPSWDSPWGEGRPGWHIECSAMSCHTLGNHFDIHGGGADLLFPHHENEIAQSEAANDSPFVNTWMHVGFLQINREKMSKSLGNFFSVHDVTEKYSMEVVRYFLLSSHYRSQLNYTDDNLTKAQNALSRLYRALRDLNVNKVTDIQATLINKEAPYIVNFRAAMDDDFNTPQALAVLFDLAHEINGLKETDIEKAKGLGEILKSLAGILGILYQSPEDFLREGVSDVTMAEIEKLIAERNEARAQKDWARADALRGQLHELNIELEDKADKTIWRRK